MEWARACPKRSQAVWTLTQFFFPSSIFIFGAYFNSGVSVRLRSPALPAFTLYFACHVTQLCTETELTDLGGESRSTWSGSGRLLSTLVN